MTFSGPSAKLIVVIAAAGIIAAAVACRGGGANPGTVTIPVINPTVSTRNCLNDGYPADAPAFGDNASFAYQEQSVTTPAGVVPLRYFDHEAGTGAVPAADSIVLVHYTGWLESGCVFDFDWDEQHAARFRLSDVIVGWDEGIKTMKVGGKRRLEVPPQLGYGPIGSPPVIPANATLVFEVELVGLLTPPEATATIAVIITSTTTSRVATATAFSLTATAAAPTPSAATKTVLALTPAATPESATPVPAP